MMDRPSLVVSVIVNWRRYDDTNACLSSLARSRYPHHRAIVIDNESNGQEAAKLKAAFPTIELIKNQRNEGFARACNQGIAWALEQGAAFVLFLNNDAVAGEAAISTLVEYLQNTPRVGIAGPLITYGDSAQIWSAGGRLNEWTGRTRHCGIGQPTPVTPPKPSIKEFVTGCALMARAHVLRELAGLDERYFMYFEDVDLCFRARQAGYEIAVVPSARVAHQVSASAGQRGTNRVSALQAYLLGRNRTFFASTRLPRMRRIAFLVGTATIGALDIVKRGRTAEAIRLYYHGMWHSIRHQEPKADRILSSLIDSIDQKNKPA